MVPQLNILLADLTIIDHLFTIQQTPERIISYLISSQIVRVQWDEPMFCPEGALFRLTIFFTVEERYRPDEERLK